MEVCNQNKVIAELDSILVDDAIYERWLVYADKRLKLFASLRLREKYEAKDIVHTVLCKLYVGERKWDFDKFPNLTAYVFLLIKSVISNLVCFEEKFIELDNLESISGDDGIWDITENEKCPRINAIIDEIETEELKNLCLGKLNDDEDACIVFMEMLEGYSSNQNIEIAGRLGVDVQFVENAVKRIRRKLKDVFAEYKEVYKKTAAGL